MCKWQKALVARLLILSSLFLWGCFFSAPIDITGTWIGTMEWTSGPASGFVYGFSMNLFLDNKEVTGAVTLPSHAGLTFDIPIVQGRARSVNLSLVARGPNPLLVDEPTIEFEIEGRYGPTSMSGEGAQTIDGVTYTFDWEAELVTTATAANL